MREQSSPVIPWFFVAVALVASGKPGKVGLVETFQTAPVKECAGIKRYDRCSARSYDNCKVDKIPLLCHRACIADRLSERRDPAHGACPWVSAPTPLCIWWLGKSLTHFQELVPEPKHDERNGRAAEMNEVSLLGQDHPGDSDAGAP